MINYKNYFNLITRLWGLKAGLILMALGFLFMSCSSKPSNGSSASRETKTMLGSFKAYGQLYDPRGGQLVQAGATQDSHIVSPKSLNFTKDNKKVYINALEGLQTLVYSFPDLKLIKAIDHSFSPQNSNLFKNGETTVFDYPYHHQKNSKQKNVFSGKPVEGVFSHNDRYFWV
ncbi:MAG: hypothetical protein LBE80_08695, partial [Deltaproteobacteria bacterium]|nr:hypothetical protein [Deltaproteobacteria bacterium]